MNEGTMVPTKIPSSNKRGYKMYLYSNRFSPGLRGFDHTSYSTNAQYLKNGAPHHANELIKIERDSKL